MKCPDIFEVSTVIAHACLEFLAMGNEWDEDVFSITVKGGNSCRRKGMNLPSTTVSTFNSYQRSCNHTLGEDQVALQA